MLISVLIPLEFHRDQAAVAIGKWRQEQTMDGELFELVVIASRHSRSSDLDAIRALLGPRDRLLVTDAAHDVAQVAEAATHARSDLLFFTESHVLPTPEVLTQCVELFARHPEWSAFSCRTHGIVPNRLARAEARMYEADILHGMTSHPWRKILDQCFATRRSAYEAAGGFDGSLGHFAEFVLAARYATLGLTIGYAPEIELAHCYIGHVPTLREFTADFVAGEITYWQWGQQAREENLIEPPIEWWRRGDHRRDLAVHLLKIARKHHQLCETKRLTSEDLKALYRRHAAAALTGAGAARVAAYLDYLRERVRLAWRCFFATDEKLHVSLQGFTSATARLGRLAPGRRTGDFGASSQLWTPGPDDAERGCGFHAAEVFDGIPFRWSEELAVVVLALPPGRHRLCVQTLLTRLTTSEQTPAFYFNGRRIKAEKVKYKQGNFVFEVKRTEGEGAKLGWVSGRQPAPGDPRHLGLPVSMISLAPAKREPIEESRALDGVLP